MSYIGKQASLGYGASATPISGILMIKIGSQEISSIEDTNLDSSSTHRTFRPGLTDPGSWSVDLIYSPDAVELLESLLGVITLFSVSHVQSDEDFSANGFLMKTGEVSMEPDALMKISGVEIKLTGVETIGDA